MLLRYLALILLLSPTLVQAKEPLVDQVKKSINDGIRYLRDLENGKGDFEHTTVIARVRKGGVTALATVALLVSGVPADDPLIQRCLKYLRSLPPDQTYTVGLQTMAFCLAKQEQDRQLVQKNLKWLAENRVAGGWGYDTTVRSPDHSINQYALLGIHEAHLAGFKIDEALMKDMYDYYRSQESGEWGYRNAPRPTLTMTTAGLCNLLITAQDLVKKRDLDRDGIDKNCGFYDDNTTVNKAIRYIGDTFPNDIGKQGARFPHPFYSLYGIERAGRLTGRRFFGEHDWYRVGCEWLVSTQNQNGSWEGKNGFDIWPPVATSFSLLFLSKGRTPILISKFAHGIQNLNVEAWNTKRHDVRHLVEFCSRELFDKHPLGWQAFDITNVRDRKPTELAEELLQSPVVYITGHDLVNVLNRNEELVLKEFVSNGGFILGHACCGGDKKGANFDKQFRELIKNITGSELTPLPNTHPVWGASGKFQIDPRTSRYKLEGVNQGCKTVVIYIKEPISGWWENNDTESKQGKEAFQVAGNIIAYATGMQIPKPRLTEVEIVRESEGKQPPRGYLQVAQLVPSLDALPLAPKAIPNVMAELGKLQLEVHRSAKKLTLTTEDLLNFKFFYMHDRTGYRVPSAEALTNLRYTLEHDGLLLADAACGSKAFDKAFREMIATMWPKEKYPDRQLVAIDLKANQAKNELFSKEVNGTTIETVKYRREEKDGLPSKDFQSGPPRLEGVKINGRWAVIYSKYDIGCALEKHQSTECLGHDYESAKLLARAVILYALRH